METIRLRRLPAFRAAVAASAGPNGLDKAITLILMGAICILMATLVAPAMRDNDQAGLIAGALQIARGEVPFDQAGFYNYDKQYGTYLLLAALYRIAPAADPVAAGNLLQVALLTVAFGAVAVRWARTAFPPLILVLPVLLSPVVVLFGPFLGTGSVSLAFLLLAFAALKPRMGVAHRLAVCALIAVATACRGDVALAVPALFLADAASSPLRALLRRPTPWLLGLSAVVPVLIGKTLDVNSNADFLGISFVPQVWVAFTCFGLGAAGTLLLVLYAAAFLALGIARPRRTGFYLALVGATLLPMAFYSVQLSTPRYFLLSAAILLFFASSRRSRCLYRAAWRARHGAASGLATLLCAASIAPWIVGLQAPALDQIRPTMVRPTLLPSSDGLIPMGAYLAFAINASAHHFLVDHNQKIWLSSRSTDYRMCGDGLVPLLGTGMVNYLDLAVRMDGKYPRIVTGPDDASCGFAYSDTRSLIRSYGGAGPGEKAGFFKRPISVASTRPELGQPILEIDAVGEPTTSAIVLDALRNAFKGKEFEVYFSTSGPAGGDLTVELAQPFKSVAFASDPSCRTQPESIQAVTPPLLAIWPDGASDLSGNASIRCKAASLVGWATAIHPAYIGQ